MSVFLCTKGLQGFFRNICCRERGNPSRFVLAMRYFERKRDILSETKGTLSVARGS